MYANTRREFLANVGKGMLVASVGSALVAELGLTPAFATEIDDNIGFGPLESLASLMQDTPVRKLQPLLCRKLKDGTSLRTLIAAGALANARTFGGQDYDGYHAMMALVPAYEMSSQLPVKLSALPVLKVLHRNTARIQSQGGRSREVLKRIEPGRERPSAETLRELVRKRDMRGAEREFARMATGPIPEAFHSLQFVIQDDIDVHRIVLAWRAWDTLRLTGEDHAHTLLRQCVRHCVAVERRNVRRGLPEPQIRSLLPQLMDDYKLLGQSLGTRTADDAWIDRFSRVIFSSDRQKAAEAVAAALRDGFSSDVISEAISLAANLLVLHDPGRTEGVPGKPIGSVHGASVGVHASDSANAWRHVAKICDHRNTVASLIVAGYHTAGQSGRVEEQPFPYAEHRGKVAVNNPRRLLAETEAAIRRNDQALACSLIERYGGLGQPARPVFDLMLKYAVSEDGALHAEKYYHTVREEFAATRSAFRWRHLIALARVTASEYGHPAPGLAEARHLLGVS